MFFFFFKQKTAYEMRISDWSSDVCSSDLFARLVDARERLQRYAAAVILQGAAQILPVAAHGERRGADRAAEIEGEDLEIGRASCRERVCQYVSISVVAGSLKKKNIEYNLKTHNIPQELRLKTHNYI